MLPNIPGAYSKQREGQMQNLIEQPAGGFNPEVNERYLPARDVWERYGVTSMTIGRWLADPRMAFPRPIYMGRFRYWSIAALAEWERSRPRRMPEAA